MDINIIPTLPASQVYTPQASKASAESASTPSPQTVPQIQSATEGSSQTDSTVTAEANKRAAIEQAAAAAPFNYPLGDKSFAIYKDASGQYITRYVSLRDGSVSYIPEPTLVRHLPPATTTVGIAISA